MSKRRVLVVDDDESVCELVRTVLELEGFEVADARHVIEAERLIGERVPDAIVLDIGLPGIDGLFYCQRLRENPATRTVPIVVISGSREAGARAKAAGANAYLRKPLDPLELLPLLDPAADAASEGAAGDEPGSQLRRLIEIGRRQHDLHDEIQRQTLLALSSALDSREAGSSDHSARVTAYAVRLALEVEPALTDDPSLEWGFRLHDIGMVSIADRILLKPGPLTPAERTEMERHPLLGEQFLAAMPHLQGHGLRVVRSHHERWDGRGYPDRLGEHEIPSAARIFAVVDALDAMTDHRRPYRQSVTWEAALEELNANAGTQFDPDAVDGLVACEPDLRAIRAEGSRLLESAV